MIRVLLDANVIFTYLTKREDPFLHECEEIIRLCAEGKIEGFIALHSLSIVWYLMRKYPVGKITGWTEEDCFYHAQELIDNIQK